jgi:hypothetical protein
MSSPTDTTDAADALESDTLDPTEVIDTVFASASARASAPDDAAADETPRGRIRVPREGALSPAQAVEALRRSLERGIGWYPALLEVIARWTAPSEEIDGTLNTYLIAGEAFDWLLLAQRLLDDVADLVPVDEAEQLLVHGIAPDGSGEAEFEAAIGPAKHRAHLNFQYGVVVEELLLLAVELELVKSGSLSGAGRPAPDIEAFEHVYGKPLTELKLLYAYESGTALAERMSQSELQAFTYWLSKYRVRTGEPARVASDTKKAMAMMSRLEAGRARLGRLHAAQARAGRVVETDGPRRAAAGAPPNRIARAAAKAAAARSTAGASDATDDTDTTEE